MNSANASSLLLPGKVVESDGLGEAGEEERGLAPRRVDLAPLHGHRGETPQSTSREINFVIVNKSTFLGENLVFYIECLIFSKLLEYPVFPQFLQIPTISTLSTTRLNPLIVAKCPTCQMWKVALKTFIFFSLSICACVLLF